MIRTSLLKLVLTATRAGLKKGKVMQMKNVTKRTSRTKESVRRSRAQYQIVTPMLFTSQSTSTTSTSGMQNMLERHYQDSSSARSMNLPVKKQLLLEITAVKKSEEKKTKPKPNRKRKICPLPGCMVITERLPQHLQRTHKLKREDPKYKKYLSLAKVVSKDKPHAFMHMKEEMGRMQRLTPEFVVRGEELEDTGDNSEDGFLLNVQSYDCDEKQDVFDLSPPENELAEMTESTEMVNSVGRDDREHRDGKLRSQKQLRD